MMQAEHARRHFFPPFEHFTYVLSDFELSSPNSFLFKLKPRTKKAYKYIPKLSMLPDARPPTTALEMTLMLSLPPVGQTSFSSLYGVGVLILALHLPGCKTTVLG